MIFDGLMNLLLCLVCWNFVNFLSFRFCIVCVFFFGYEFEGVEMIVYCGFECEYEGYVSLFFFFGCLFLFWKILMLFFLLEKLF